MGPDDEVLIDWGALVAPFFFDTSGGCPDPRRLSPARSVHRDLRMLVQRHDRLHQPLQRNVLNLKRRTRDNFCSDI